MTKARKQVWRAWAVFKNSRLHSVVSNQVYARSYVAARHAILKQTEEKPANRFVYAPVLITLAPPKRAAKKP